MVEFRGAMVTSGAGVVTGSGQEKASLGQSWVSVSGGYTGVYILWELVKLHESDLCTLLYVYYTVIFKKNTENHDFKKPQILKDKWKKYMNSQFQKKESKRANNHKKAKLNLKKKTLVPFHLLKWQK